MTDQATPSYRIGQRVLTRTTIHGERIATVRSLRWDDEGERLTVVDFDPPQGRSPSGHSNGWPLRDHQIIGPASEAKS